MATPEEVGWAIAATIALFFLAQYVDARRVARGPATLALTFREMVMAVNAWVRDFLTLTRTTLLAFGLLGSIFFVFPHLIGLDPFAWAGVLTFLVGIGRWLGLTQLSAVEAAAVIGFIFVVLWAVVRLTPRPIVPPATGRRY